MMMSGGVEPVRRLGSGAPRHALDPPGLRRLVLCKEAARLRSTLSPRHQLNSTELMLAMAMTAITTVVQSELLSLDSHT
jgi:hypothetical protein